jgi:hypothetical protein
MAPSSCLSSISEAKSGENPVIRIRRKAMTAFAGIMKIL